MKAKVLVDLSVDDLIALAKAKLVKGGLDETILAVARSEIAVSDRSLYEGSCVAATISLAYLEDKP